MTQSTNEAKPIYEAYVTVIADSGPLGVANAPRMTVTVYRGPSKQRAVAAYNSLGSAPVVNCRVVEHGWQVIH